MEKIALFIGYFIIFSVILVLSVLAIIFLGAVLYRFFWIPIKHLFPKYHFDKEWKREWEKTIKEADDDDWRRYVKIKTLGRFIVFYSPKSSKCQARIQFGILKK